MPDISWGTPALIAAVVASHVAWLGQVTQGFNSTREGAGGPRGRGEEGEGGGRGAGVTQQTCCMTL